MKKFDTYFKSDFIHQKMNFENLENDLYYIPRTSGLYYISTNTPIDILKCITSRNDPKHYNFSQRIKASDKLPDILRINQKEGASYIIYSGQAKNLKKRASEHFKGPKGNACLAISHNESLLIYDWYFSFYDLSNFERFNQSKTFRICLEQAYRTRIGWPILCGQ